MNMQTVTKYATRMINLSNLPKWVETRDILKQVLSGEISREDCSRGLCELIKVNLSCKYILSDYKFWSGQRGHVIYVGETTADGIENQEYLDASIRQFHDEKDQVDDAYWEARLELARHWLAFVEAVLEKYEN